jgi:hypothetical protein
MVCIVFDCKCFDADRMLVARQRCHEIARARSGLVMLLPPPGDLMYRVASPEDPRV